jgi:hypothetical protein
MSARLAATGDLLADAVDLEQRLPTAAMSFAAAPTRAPSRVTATREATKPARATSKTTARTTKKR